MKETRRKSNRDRDPTAFAVLRLRTETLPLKDAAATANLDMIEPSIWRISKRRRRQSRYAAPVRNAVASRTAAVGTWA